MSCNVSNKLNLIISNVSVTINTSTNILNHYLYIKSQLDNNVNDLIYIAEPKY